MKTSGTEASPAKAFLEQLENFRELCHETLGTIGAKLDQQIDSIKTEVDAMRTETDISKIRDIRDMGTLIGHADIKPAKARRKDLKKLDSITEDLLMVIKSW